MSLRNANGILDELFRQALEPAAEAQPSVDVWERVVREIRDAPAVRHTSPRQVSVAHIAPQPLPMWRAPHWRRFISWVHGYNTLYPPSTNNLVRIEPDGGYRPSPFAGVMVKRILDLRLVS